MYPLESKAEFEACLKLKDGTVLENGTAYIEAEDKFVVFKSSFVPLYPVGTPMEIVRIYNGKEIHRFIGNVYLSGKTIMKLTDADDILLRGSEFCYGANVSFEGTLETGIKRIFRTKRFFKTKEEAVNEDLSIKIKVCEMSLDKIVFQITNRKVARLMENPSAKVDDNRLEPGNKCTIYSDIFQDFESLNVVVRKSLEFGDNAKYVCDIVTSTKESNSVIADFLWVYNLKHNKIF